MKRFISLFTILCCVLTFVSFPAMAENSTAIAFIDDFQSETDAVPDNWEIYNNQANTSVSIVTEDGNKFLRMKKTDTTWGDEVMVSTKTGVVSLPTTGKKIVVKMKMRGSAMGNVAANHSIRLAYPKATNGTAHKDNGGNQYLAWSMRRYGSGVTVANFCYPAAKDTSGVTNSKYVTTENTWYDVTAVLDYSAKTIDYTIGNSSSGYRIFKADISNENLSLGKVSVIDNITMKLTSGSKDQYTDIDDVYACYLEDYADYLPEVLSFEDTFEDAAVNSAPANWIDRAGVSTIKVMEEPGNKYVRVTKNAGTKGSPYVVSKYGAINLPWKETGKGFIVEAKMRLHTTTGSVAYRHYLMLNAPYLATDSELTSYYNTPFFFHTNLQAYSKPGGTSLNTFAKNNEWFQYRAVIVPKGTQTEINHYFNDKFIKSDYISTSSMPDLFNSDALYNIAFPWRVESGSSATATADGYMDFDDIKIYEMKTFKHDVKFTDGNGAELNEIKNGTVNVNASIINDGTERRLDVIAALYTKDESDNWIFTEAKSVVNSDNNKYLYAYGWRSGSGSLSLNVTDAENQMIKVFVWHRGENNTRILVPVCAPYILD